MRKRIKVASMISATEIILAISAILVSGVFYIVSYDGAKNQEIKILNQQAERYHLSLTNLITKFSEMSYSISNQNETKLLKEYYYDLKNDNYGKVKALINLDDSLQNYLLYGSCVSYVGAIFKETEDYSYEIRHTDSTSSTNQDLDYLLKNVSFLGEEPNLKVYKDNLFYVFADGEEEKFKIAIQINTDEFSYFFDLQTSLTASFGDPYFVNNEFYYSISNEKVDIDIIKNEEKETRKDFNQYVKYISVCPGVNFRYSLNLNKINNQSVVPIAYLVIGSILLILITTLTLLVMNNYMKKPIYEVKKAMEAISKGDFHYQIEEKTNTDLQEIFDGFNSMSKLLNDYINDNYIQEIRVKDANFKVLQSQIHPHFLYNCFATIQSLIKLKEYDKAGVLTKELSLYYSYITKNKNIFVSLKEEWDHMYRYLTIQKIRFEDNVTYLIDNFDEKNSQYLVPRIIFQPIVENSFKYAFKNIDNGILKISYKTDDNYLYFVFEDNGTIEDQTIEELNKKIHEKDIETSGLINVAQRILSYSQNDSMVIIERSEKLKGLKITFKFKK